MKNNIIPIKIQEITGDIYAGFWRRLGSILLDLVFIFPLTYLILYFNSLEKNNYFYTIIPILIFNFWYCNYLPKKYGGTPGKLISGIIIIKLNGEAIDWKESILREIVNIGITLIMIIKHILFLLRADTTIFNSLSRVKQNHYLMSFSPVLYFLPILIYDSWILSELIVLLTNKRKRAIHDFIAGTVIVRKIYIDRIRKEMNPTEPALD